MKGENMSSNATSNVYAVPVSVEATVVSNAYEVNDNNIHDQRNHQNVQAAHNEANTINNLNEGGAREFLSSHHWPVGLQDILMKNLTKIPIRFFICDDSGSMMASDGHRLVAAGNKQKLVGCSRWTELTEALKFHANLSKAASTPSEFRLLNGAEPILVGTDQDSFRFGSLMAVLEGSPNGGTPLCRHIREVTATIQNMEPQLRAANQKACVIIATDGESSDGDVAQALRPLKDLPVWVVVRLCTDEDKIVNYWNNIDTQLELEMDVLDDLTGEAGEVYESNPWLTYAEPLHRLREFGISVKEIDLLDETKLPLEQVRFLCSAIFGVRVQDIPHPEVDWSAFIAKVQDLNNQAGMVWSVKHNAPRHWIDTSRLTSVYGKGGCVIG